MNNQHCRKTIALVVATAVTLGAAVASMHRTVAGETAKAKTAKPDKVVKTDAEWKKILTPAQFDVLRRQGTETPGSSPLLRNHQKGVFRCVACNKELFSFTTKFESGTGWPSFYAPLPGAIETRPDHSDGTTRTEVLCSRCGGHLGHVFDDGPKPTGLRYCMNGVALKFEKRR